MLNCCGSGVTVVNIDNGFGAACAADDICASFQARFFKLSADSLPRIGWPL
jgi:hypothetical protein